MSEPSVELPPEDPSGLGPPVRQSWLERYDVAQKAGGLVAPVLTALLAFLVGGLVVLVTTGKNPLTTYRAIFEGAGFNWFLPWVGGQEREFAALNLQQTLIVTTTLILTGLAVAFAFRCGLFNIGGQGQYIVGAVIAVWIGSSFEGLNPFVHIVLAAGAGALMRCRLGRDRRVPQGHGRGARGDLDDHAQLDRDLGRRLPLRARRAAAERQPGVRADLERHRRRREAAGLLGRSAPAGAPHRVLRRDRRPRRLLADPQPHDARLRRQGRRLQPGGRALRRDQRRRATTSWRWRSRARSPGSPARSTSSAGSSGSAPATSSRRPSPSSGIAVALLGRNTAIGVAPRGPALRRSPHRHVDAQPRSRRSSSPSSRPT